MSTGSDDDSLAQLINEIKDVAFSDDFKSESELGTISIPASNKSNIKEIETSTFPTTMNCSQAFDLIVKCYSLGGLARDYYRYGEVANCGDRVAKWKFCMKSKFDQDKEESIRQYYITQAAKRSQTEHSSESVWNCRTHALYHPFREDSEEVIKNMHKNSDNITG